MDQNVSMALKLEIIWWIFTLLIAVGVLFPILHVIEDYPFLVMNVLFVIIFITFTRYIFLLKYTPLAYRQYFKMAIIALSVPLIFYLIGEMNTFQAYMGEEGMETFMPQLHFKHQESLGKYIRNEMILFGVGSIFTAVLLPFRMIMSIWRVHNRGAE